MSRSSAERIPDFRVSHPDSRVGVPVIRRFSRSLRADGLKLTPESSRPSLTDIFDSIDYLDNKITRWNRRERIRVASVSVANLGPRCRDERSLTALSRPFGCEEIIRRLTAARFV
jgi:hypothetical protein